MKNNKLEPNDNCKICKRLDIFRKQNRIEEPHWYNKPVKSFGSISSKILIVGLAPGKKGANRTGRPFTGDGAGKTLYSTLINHRFAKGNYCPNGLDDLELINCRISNVVRCVPPQNKPKSSEFKNCSKFLKKEIDSMKNLELILALGRDSYLSILKVFELKYKQFSFIHNNLNILPNKIKLISSFHCSQYNTNTKRLTIKMFNDVFIKIKKNINFAL
tara:strand:- start:1177 stop:1827 length:651 start_codon:yes stop_codon:yes gene_type:complete